MIIFKISKNIFEIDLEICLKEKILDTTMKRAPVEFLRVLGIQCIIGIVFSFSVTLKPNVKCLLCFHLLTHHNFY